MRSDKVTLHEFICHELVGRTVHIPKHDITGVVKYVEIEKNIEEVCYVLLIDDEYYTALEHEIFIQC